MGIDDATRGFVSERGRVVIIFRHVAASKQGYTVGCIGTFAIWRDYLFWHNGFKLRLVSLSLCYNQPNEHMLKICMIFCPNSPHTKKTVVRIKIYFEMPKERKIRNFEPSLVDGPTILLASLTLLLLFCSAEKTVFWVQHREIICSAVCTFLLLVVLLPWVLYPPGLEDATRGRGRGQFGFPGTFGGRSGAGAGRAPSARRSNAERSAFYPESLSLIRDVAIERGKPQTQMTATLLPLAIKLM